MSLILILILAPQKIIINARLILLRLTTDSRKIGGGYRVFCNPPYSNIAAWVKKAYREATKDNTLVVLLIPARTDTKYFQEYIYHRSEIRFIKGRLKFGESKNSAPFPSMVVIFRAGGLT